MKKTIVLSVVLGLLPWHLMAQDDLYFTPSKKAAKVETTETAVETPTYYSGISRSDDEYNRRGQSGSFYQKVGTDSLGNDIIEFYPGNGDYAAGGDSLARYDFDDDFTYSRRMSRFDGYLGFYGWYDPWSWGYWGAPWHRWGWYDPWYAGYGWGWGGYYGWYDPWYYGWGWGYPYHHYDYYGYYGWGHPVGWGHHAYGPSGTRNHSFNSYGVNNGAGENTRFGGTRTAGGFGSRSGATTTRRSSSTNNTRFGGTRQPWSTNTRSVDAASRSNGDTYSNRSNSSSHSSGSFGGSRSGSFGGGSFGGGSRGGGSFGGGSRGGFGGRR